jgi:predicted DNA-binding transcriptional regulator AlpA
MISENTSLLNDQMVDMKFITAFTGLTDKWFYKLISEGDFPQPIKMGRAPAGLKARWKPGYSNALHSPVSNLSNAITSLI